MVGHTTVHDAARALAQASARCVTTRPSSISATMEVGGADRHHSWSPRPMLPAPSIILAGTHGFNYSPVAPTDATPGLQRQYRWSPEAISSGLQTSKYSTTTTQLQYNARLELKQILDTQARQIREHILTSSYQHQAHTKSQSSSDYNYLRSRRWLVLRSKTDWRPVSGHVRIRVQFPARVDYAPTNSRIAGNSRRD